MPSGRRANRVMQTQHVVRPRRRDDATAASAGHTTARGLGLTAPHHKLRASGCPTPRRPAGNLGQRPRFTTAGQGPGVSDSRRRATNPAPHGQRQASGRAFNARGSEPMHTTPPCTTAARPPARTRWHRHEAARAAASGQCGCSAAHARHRRRRART